MSDPNDFDSEDAGRNPRYDLAAEEEKKGMNIFQPVVIGFGAALLLGLLAALLLLTAEGRRLLPGFHSPHPTSYVVEGAPRAWAA